MSDNVKQLLLHQLKNFFFDTDAEVLFPAVEFALDSVYKNFSVLKNRHLFDGDSVKFDTNHSITWMIFLYRVSHELGTNTAFRKDGKIPKEADQVYYLNKIMHSVDWYHQVNIPEHFICEHPLGSVLGRAEYGDYLMIYHGTTIGGNPKNGTILYPTIGNNVALFSNSTILGKSHIGNNVLISANSYLLDEIVPDNCIVFGSSPDIIIKKKPETEIKRMTAHIWNWNKIDGKIDF